MRTLNYILLFHPYLVFNKESIHVNIAPHHKSKMFKTSEEFKEIQF